MLRIERDAAFWAGVVSHPQVSHVMLGKSPDAIGDLVARADVLPLANENGGFVFIPLDSFGRVVELHTLIAPEGWGRKAILSGAECLDWVFGTFDLVVTHHVLGWPRSKPWSAFGFAPSSEPFEALEGLTVQTWSLSKFAWLASPARNRLCPSSPLSLQ